MAASSSSSSSSPSPSSFPHLSFLHNAFNALLLVGVSVPVFLFYSHFLSECPKEFPSVTSRNPSPLSWDSWNSSAPLMDNICQLGLAYPAEFLHVLLLINMDILLWVVALIQGSTWLIDPYWTIIPVQIALFYQFHPLSHWSHRACVCMCLLYLWSIRLTHSYFRREEWQFGAREDWRFTRMRSQWEPRIGKFGWAVTSIFIVYISQHIFLYGVTLPIYAVFFNSQPPHLTVSDFLCVLMCSMGLFIAYSSDTTLRNFMKANEEKQKRGQQKIAILQEGWWAYSRHPNYFGEILFWSGMSGFACICGAPSFTWGTVVNALCLVTVSFMVEERMSERKDRIQQFQQYKDTVSILIPWFRKEGKQSKKQK